MSNEEQRRVQGEPDRVMDPEKAPTGMDANGEVPGGTTDEREEEIVEAEIIEEDGPEPSPEAVGVTPDEDLAAELEQARRERDEHFNDMLRMKAEMENSRKRLERDRARLSQLASERLVRELLPVLDNLERALEVEGDIREGVRATRDGLLAALAREGLEPVASDGADFDPTVHEAVMGQPSEEHEEDTVIQTLERGYTLNGRAIRPAKVIVAKQV